MTDWYKPQAGYRNPTDEADPALRVERTSTASEDEILYRAAIITARRAAEKRSQLAPGDAWEKEQKRKAKIKSFLLWLAAIVWLALSAYGILSGQSGKGIHFDINGNCHGEGCAQWEADGE